MSRQWPLNSDYSYWIYQQLEPDDVIVTGNYKRYNQTKPAWMEKMEWYNKHFPNEGPARKAFDELTDEEIEQIEKREDEYLKSHGIC